MRNFCPPTPARTGTVTVEPTLPARKKAKRTIWAQSCEGLRQRRDEADAFSSDPARSSARTGARVRSSEVGQPASSASSDALGCRGGGATRGKDRWSSGVIREVRTFAYEFPASDSKKTGQSRCVEEDEER
eukprot:6879233-Pyramimonas_sp.AAC.1